MTEGREQALPQPAQPGRRPWQGLEVRGDVQLVLVGLRVTQFAHGRNECEDQFRERETGKTYLALVTGTWPANKKVIDLPLHKYLQAGPEGTSGAGERRVRVTTADDPDGMRSITLVKVRSTAAARPEQGLPAMSLLEVTIKTGRTHQIRVHLASQGHAIVGDDKYGDFDLNKRLQKQGMKRMFLHAWRLQFNHPASGERVQLIAELPPELADFVPTA